ncbi:MAG: exodeoxyribonuclease V subunit alpha [Pseudomonadales bacterium]
MAESMSVLDRCFSEWVADNFSAKSTKKDSELLKNIAAATSFSVSLKHTCLDLSVCCDLGEPELSSLMQGVTAKEVKRVVADSVKPLVASEDGRLVWLQKYHAFETAVAEKLKALHDAGRLEIITGGPGTGKTWNAAERIKKELSTNPQCVIKLAAPTGKAANNMMNALARSQFDAHKHNLKGLTLHSLLSMNGRSPKPRHHTQNPLSCDLLIVDEASMIDLPMMYRLLDAIPSHATLLLLGDKDQLASVEAGSVLADICRALENTGCIKRLTESRRYKNSPEIGVLAMALNEGAVPNMAANQSVIHHVLPNDFSARFAWLDSAAIGYAWVADALKVNAPIKTLLEKQTDFQVLCALREGPFGVQGINRAIAEKLGHKADSWYEGQPVMVTQNNHDRKLYNGDVGMVLPCEGGEKRACFLVNGEVKTISRAQMPAYETCYAITVHKSQGSEYDRVMIVLLADAAQVAANPVLTRELIYTAVTRAKSKIELWSGEQVLQIAAQKTTQRMSGLQTLLLRQLKSS